MDNFDETEVTSNNHIKKIQWNHICICIIILSIFFIVLSIFLNKDEQAFLFNNINITHFFSNAKTQVENTSSNISNESDSTYNQPTQEVNNSALVINEQPQIVEETQGEIIETTNPEIAESVELAAIQQSSTPEQIDSVTEEPIITIEEPTTNSITSLTSEQYEKIIHIYTQSPDKTVYLTFDDGPSPNITPLILDELKKDNVKATFFMLGTNATYYPNLVKRAYDEGHYIANHGYSHKYSEIYENTETVLNDYQLCEQALKKALNDDNYQSKVYRFPGGSSGGYYDNIKQEARNLLKENNIAYLDWNALTYDAENAHTKESILENLENTVGEKNVVVLLMHDSSSKILTYETLPDVINFFIEKGYTFRTLYDVLQ